MQDYGKIQELFGSPLNTVPKPHTPFKWQPWHFVALAIGGYLIFKGYQKVKEEYFPNKFPRIKKSDDSE